MTVTALPRLPRRDLADPLFGEARQRQRRRRIQRAAVALLVLGAAVVAWAVFNRGTPPPLATNRKPASSGQQADVARAIATAIKARLIAQGYTIEFYSLAGAKGPVGSASAASQFSATPSARGAQQAFSVQADFASQHSFILSISVFRSHADAVSWAASADPAIATRCGGGCRQRITGPVIYGGFTNNGTTLPRSGFDGIVALASGTPSGH
jgi:hypothetical protein